MENNEKKSSKFIKGILLGSFYLLVVGIVLMVIYYYRLDKYEFYLKVNNATINTGGSYQIELIPKDMANFDYLNYLYEVVNDNIATVDENGTIKALSEGTTEVKIKYKNSLEYKTLTLKVENVEIESIKFNENFNLNVNESIKLNPIVNGQDDLNVDVVYESDDPDIADVDEFGNLTAIGEGQTKIIAETDEGIVEEIVVNITKPDENITKEENKQDNQEENKQDNQEENKQDNQEDNKQDNKENEKNKTIEVSNIRINQTSISMKEKTSTKIYVTVSPSYATNYTLHWTSSNDNVYVSNQGVVTAKKVGQSIVTVTSNNGHTASCTVNVSAASVSVKSISLNTNVATIYVDDTFTLIPTVNPSNATIRNITWSSSNENVATVDNGVVTGVGEGEAIITAKSTNNKKVTCKITVNKKTEIKLNTENTTLYENKTFNLSVTPNINVTWSSSNKNVATVSEDGLVTAVKKGTAIITATTSEGISATATIIVKEDTTPTTTVSKVYTDQVTDTTKQNMVYLENGTFYYPKFNKSNKKSYSGQYCPKNPTNEGYNNKYGYNDYFWSMLSKMISDSYKAGYKLVASSTGCRSYSSQVTTKKNRGDYAATPGASKHGFGIASDLTFYKNKSSKCASASKRTMSNCKGMKWAHDHAKDYGLTFISSENWHIQPRKLATYDVK